MYVLLMDAPRKRTFNWWECIHAYPLLTLCFNSRSAINWAFKTLAIVLPFDFEGKNLGHIVLSWKPDFRAFCNHDVFLFIEKVRFFWVDSSIVLSYFIPRPPLPHASMPRHTLATLSLSLVPWVFRPPTQPCFLWGGGGMKHPKVILVSYQTSLE